MQSGLQVSALEETETSVTEVSETDQTDVSDTKGNEEVKKDTEETKKVEEKENSDTTKKEETKTEETKTEEKKTEEKVDEKKKTKKEETKQDTAEEKTEEKTEKKKMPAVSKKEEINGVTIKVEAPEGAFEEGVKVSVKKEEGSTDTKKAFDITFTDSNDKEVQPATGSKVKVSFTVDANSGLTPEDKTVKLSLVHIVNSKSETIATAETKGKTVTLTAEVDHFSEFDVVAETVNTTTKKKATPKRGDATERTDITITNFSITHEDESNTSPTFKYHERFKLNLDWDASAYGNTLKEGDYFNVTLPENMRFPNNTSATQFDLTAPDGSIIAHAVVTPGSNGGGTIKVTFTDYVEDRYDIKGEMQLTAFFTHIVYDEVNSFEVTVGSSVQTIQVPISGPVGLDDEVIGKWGEAVSNVDDEARWYIRINHTQGELSNFVLSDQLYVNNGDLGGMQYITDSFILREVVYSEYGGVTQVISSENISDRVQFSDNNTKFSLNLGDLNGKQYQLMYRTTYIPGTVLRNRLTANYDEGHKTTGSSYSDATSSGSGDGSLMSKLRIIKVDEDDNTTKLAGAVFTVTDKDGNSFTLTTDANGEATSQKLTPGKFTIKEVAAPEGYELNDEEIEVTVSSSEATIKTITDKKIEKTEVSGQKTWDDHNSPARPDKVTVRLFADGTEVDSQDLTVDNSWKYNFTDLPKMKDGKEIVYTVEEDDVEYYTSTKEQTDTGYDFKNTYTAEGSVTFEGTKTLVGREIKEGETFTFEITEDGKTVGTAESDSTGKINYPTINYTLDDVGEHVYEIVETSKDGNGITVDNNKYSVTVKVEDNADGTLKVTPSGDIYQNLNFTNKYGATGSITFRGTKSIDSRSIQPGETFTFKITENGETLAEVTNNDSGIINYPTINYTVDDIGTHTYTVEETSTDGKGITVDTTKYTVTVEVSDNGDGTLKVTPSDNYKQLDFMNAYKATGEVEITVNKELTGRELKNGQFTFTLTEENVEEENPVVITAVDTEEKLTMSAVNDEKGNVVFDKITYTEKDAGKIFTYTIKENIPEGATDNGDGTFYKDGYTYDGHSTTVKVTVTDNYDGTLNTVGEYEDGETPVFKNSYKNTSTTTASFNAMKVLKGKKLDKNAFTFEVVDANGKVVATGKNVAASANKKAAIVFNKELTFTAEDAGKTYTYKMREVNTKKTNIIYSKDIYTVKVKVGDELDNNKLGPTTVTYLDASGKEVTVPVFTNKVKPQKKTGVKTGDPTTVIVPIVIAIVALAVLIIIRNKR